MPKRGTRKVRTKHRKETRKYKGGRSWWQKLTGVPRNRNKPRNPNSSLFPSWNNNYKARNERTAKYKKNLANYRNRKQNFTFKSVGNWNNTLKNATFKNAMAKINAGKRKRQCLERCQASCSV